MDIRKLTPTNYLALLAVAAIAVCSAVAVRAQAPAGQDADARPRSPTSADKSNEDADKKKPARRMSMQAVGPRLVQGLKDTPGCLGVELANTQSGKNVIFAWFENKKAVMAWYRSEVHQTVMFRMFGGPTNDRVPLEQISEDSGPIMCIASIVHADPQQVKEGGMPFKEISIELYSPMPAGIRLNGGFTPREVKVPGRIDEYGDKSATPASPEKPADKAP